MQDDLPGMEPLEEGGRQQGLEHGGGHDDEGKRLAQTVQQLVRLVLLVVRPDVVHKCQVLFSYFGSCGRIARGFDMLLLLSL